MKYTQLAERRRNFATVIAVFVAVGLATAHVNAQATQYYPPSPRARYAWRPATPTYAAVQSAAYTAPVAPPPGVAPVTTYQPAPALVPPPSATGCCGQACAPAVYAPTYAESAYVPAAPGVTAYRPLIELTPPPPTYTVGRGLWGQSKVYVPYQPIRNTIRYLTP